MTNTTGEALPKLELLAAGAPNPPAGCEAAPMVPNPAVVTPKPEEDAPKPVVLAPKADEDAPKGAEGAPKDVEDAPNSAEDALKVDWLDEAPCCRSWPKGDPEAAGAAPEEPPPRPSPPKSDTAAHHSQATEVHVAAF